MGKGVKKYTSTNEFEAAQWSGKLWEIEKLFLPGEVIKTNEDGSILLLHTYCGVVEVKIGDWILKGLDGEYHKSGHALFVKMYKEVK